jgi:hypothetical protein
VGRQTSTPLDFRASVEPDDEHTELAWLVTRGLWGDLARDLTSADTEAAEEMARSVTRRLRRAQPGVTRLLAFGSRASLRDPYSTEIPNLWASWLRRGALRSAVGARVRRLRALRRLLPLGGLLPLGVVVALLFTACAQDIPLEGLPGRVELPERIVPDTLDRYSFRREPAAEDAFTRAGRTSLVGDGRVFTIREGGDVHGYLEVAAFKPGLGAGRPEIRQGVLRGIAAGTFRPERLGTDRIHVMTSGEQTFYLFFPPSGRWFQLLVARQDFPQGRELFAGLLAFQRGERPPGTLVQRIIDPRRGGED